jgi:hypothetical protein
MCDEYRFYEPDPKPPPTPDPKTTPPPPPTPSTPSTPHMETGTILMLLIATMIGTVICMAIGYVLGSKCGPRAHARLATDADAMDENTAIVRRRSQRGRGDGNESIPIVEPNIVLVDGAVEPNLTFEQEIVRIEQPSPEETGDTIVDALLDDEHLIGYYASVQRRLDLYQLSSLNAIILNK